MTNDRIIEKVKKLLALASDPVLRRTKLRPLPARRPA